jgi:(R,R)-butanediol dehydrogenase / meso-butanediol dehydrogenase / diacetyl reductase
MGRSGMLAALLHGNRDLRIEEVPEPEPGPGEVKLAVAHNGLCGSDLSEYFFGPRACTTEPHPLTGGVLPQIMGHEFAGTIAALGPGVEELKMGDPVAAAPLYTCGQCAPCRSGISQLCDLVMTHGMCSHGGGLSQYTVLPARMIHRLPDGVSLAQGALIEPLSVAFGGALRSEVEPGGTAVVLGGGPIGIGVTLGLRALGVEDVVIVELAAPRRRIAAELGVEALDPTSVDVAALVRQRTGGRGADAAIDCAGSPETFRLAPAIVRARGRYVLLAMSMAEVPFSPFLLARSEIELTGSLAYSQATFARVLQSVATGAYPTTGWVEHLPLSEVHTALADLRDGRRMSAE